MSGNMTKLTIGQDIGIQFESAATWRAGAKEVACPAGEARGGVRVERLIGRTASSVEISMRVVNGSAEPIHVLSLDALRLETPDDLDMGAPWASIQAYIQGRHKNDIPSIVTLGRWDDNARDAAGGMQENGLRQAGGAASHVLESDTMTLLSGGERNLLIAFPGGQRFFCRTRIQPDGEAPALVSGCEPGVDLAPGEVLEAEPVRLRAGGDGRALIEAWADEKAARFGVPALRRAAPAVFCTWYYYGLTVTLDDVRENIAAIRARRVPYDVFQIDEGWEVTLGEWRPNAKFPIAMKDLADEIRAAGMTPGLWTSPFIAHEMAALWQAHPDWALRDRQGEPVLFPMNDTVYRVLDITIPAVVDWIRALYRTLTQDWGYRYHKLDFTRAAILYEDAPRFDMTISLPAAYRRAMEAVREGIGPDSYLLVCGGLYDAAVGIADAQRTGSDVLSMWSSAGLEGGEGGGKTVPFTVKQNLLRWYMAKWWHNDADCLMLREQKTMTRNLRLTYGLLNEAELRTLLVNQYVSGGLFSQTEPLRAISEARLWQIRHLLPPLPVESAPCRLDDERFPSQILVRGRDGALRELALINWRDDGAWSPVIRPDDIAAAWPRSGETARADRWLVVEFYGGRYHIVAPGEAVALAPIPPHGAQIVRVRPYDGARPYVVGSTAHFSLGEELETLTYEKEALTFAVNYLFPVKSAYRVLLPEGRCDGEGRRVVSLEPDAPGLYRRVVMTRPCAR